MKYDPLPSPVDVRKLTTKGAEIRADIPVSSLPRLTGLLAGDAGSVTAYLCFGIDEQGVRGINGRVQASVQVTCQRCLDTMQLPIDSSFELAIVWSDDEAKHLPRSLDPLIVGEELFDLAELIEEELILSLPFVNYHKPEECKVSKELMQDDDTLVEQPAEKENPFSVLGQLKPDKK